MVNGEWRVRREVGFVHSPFSHLPFTTWWSRWYYGGVEID
jgi:hypothetical protein